MSLLMIDEDEMECVVLYNVMNGKIVCRAMDASLVLHGVLEKMASENSCYLVRISDFGS